MRMIPQELFEVPHIELGLKTPQPMGRSSPAHNSTGSPARGAGRPRTRSTAPPYTVGLSWSEKSLAFPPLSTTRGRSCLVAGVGEGAVGVEAVEDTPGERAGALRRAIAARKDAFSVCGGLPTLSGRRSMVI
jgi:hypothetical protein